MTTPEQARQQADKAEDADWFVSQKMLCDLARQVEELQADADRYRVVRDRAFRHDDSIIFSIQNASVDTSCGYALDETLDYLRRT